MFTAVGYPVLIRGFRLALSVEGLKPRTIKNYVSDTERFAAAHESLDPQSVTPADIRAYVWKCRPAARPRPSTRHSSVYAASSASYCEKATSSGTPQTT